MPLSPEAERVVVDDYTPTYAGAFCQAMVDHPKMVRSKHPVQKYVAIGARAAEILQGHTAEDSGYEVVRRLAIGRRVIGTGTTHLAQNLLGLQQTNPPLGVMYQTSSGEVALFERNWVGG